MIVLICSGGPSDVLCPLERFLNRDDVLFIGADKGAQSLVENGITPDIIIGDFDSIDQRVFAELKQKVKKIIYANIEKDETDTDLALNVALTYEPTEILLTGVTGGRLDHEEAAKRSILRVQQMHPSICCSIENKQNRLQFLVEPNKPHVLNHIHQYVSFFAVAEPIQEVTLRGVKYETTKEYLALDSSRYTSNEIIDKQHAHIIFSNGICLMITSMD